MQKNPFMKYKLFIKNNFKKYIFQTVFCCFLLQLNTSHACTIQKNEIFCQIPATKQCLTLNYDYDNNSLPIECKNTELIDKSFNIRNIKKIVIDAGHGGKDGGCSVKGINEKDITLKIALLVGAKIHANHPEVEIIYTRKKDIFIELDERAAIGNRNKVDLFISIHCNSIGRSSVKGMEVYLLGQHRMKDQFDVAKRENESILMENNFKTRYNGYDPNSPASFIVLSMMQSNFIDQSTKFASSVNDEIKNYSHHSSNGIKQAGFLVIRETAMPSVLIETGYLTNADDRAFLNSKEGQNEIAEAISNGFSTYSGKKININRSKIEKQEDVPIEQETIDTSIVMAKKKKEKKPKEATKESTKEVIKETPKETTESSAENNTPYYMVQIATSPNKLKQKEEKWKAVEKLEERQEDGTYKYFETNFKTFKEGNDRAKALREAGFEGAFVVRYIGKVRQK